MVLGRVDGVDSEHVCVDFLEVGQIALAAIAVRERVTVLDIGIGGAVG